VKHALRLIIALSFFWMVALAIRHSVARHELLDVVLPPRVLSATTPEERQEITERLTASRRPSVLAWIPPAAILLLGSYALRTANKTTHRTDGFS
jgi:hypothetical protein